MSIWYGSADERAGQYADILAAEITHAERRPYTGSHIAPGNAYRDLLRWLKLT